MIRLIFFILFPLIILSQSLPQVRGRQPGGSYVGTYMREQIINLLGDTLKVWIADSISAIDSTTIRYIVSDTADVLRGNIADSLDAQSFLIDPVTQVLTNEGQTYEVLMHVGYPTTRYSFIDSMSLNANSVRASEIANDAVQTNHILDSTIAGNNIAAEQISGYHLIENFEGNGLYMENIDGETQILHIRVDDGLSITSDSIDVNVDGTKIVISDDTLTVGVIDSTDIADGGVSVALDLDNSSFNLDGSGLTGLSNITFGPSYSGLNVNVKGALEISNDTLRTVLIDSITRESGGGDTLSFWIGTTRFTLLPQE